MTAYGVRILIADNHPIVRASLTAVLETQPDFAIVGEAANGVQAVERATALHPDVIVLDLELPELDGVAVIQVIRAADSAAKVAVAQPPIPRPWRRGIVPRPRSEHEWALARQEVPSGHTRECSRPSREAHPQAVTGCLYERHGREGF